MTTLSWIFAVIALVGVVLNLYKKPICFWLWLVSNSGNAIYAVHKEAWSLAVLFCCYVALSVWGLKKWK